MNFNRIEHINKACQDLEATLQFYRTLFPDWFVRAQEESSSPRWVHFGDRQFYLSLYRSSNTSHPVPMETGNIDHIGLVIENGKKMIDLLKTNGIEYSLENSPETKYRIYIQDPDHTWLELVEYQESYELR